MTRIRLSEIVFDAGTQIRAAINEATVAEYAELMTTGTEFPPVVLFHDGNHYYMADGFHRGLAAQRNQFRDIEAEIRPGTKQDALWFALGANKANGQRLTAADKHNAVALALKTFYFNKEVGMSERQIADQVGCSYGYVTQVKDEVHTTMHLSKPSRVSGKDNKSYPASRPSPPPIPQHTPPPFKSVAAMPEPSSRRRATPAPPPRNGIQFARIAIMKLEEIQDHDLERQQAFDMVRRWLDAREAQAAMHA